MKFSGQETEFFARPLVHTLGNLTNEAQNQRYLSTEVLEEVQASTKSMSGHSNSGPLVNHELHGGSDCL